MTSGISSSTAGSAGMSREVNAGSGWELPVPATYVAGRDGVIGYAFADADWSRGARPRASTFVAAVRARRRDSQMKLQDRLGRDQAAAGRDARSTRGPRAGSGAIERLRMLQLVEQGLAVGDVLPDFALPDERRPDRRQRRSAGAWPAGPGILPRPLVPLLQPDARGAEPGAPAIQRLGGSLVAVAPLGRSRSWTQLATERRLPGRLHAAERSRLAPMPSSAACVSR